MRKGAIGAFRCGAAVAAGLLALASPAAGQASGERPGGPHARHGQDAPIGQPRRGFGLGGVRAKFPHTNGINRTLPINRRDTLLPPAPPRERRRDRDVVIQPHPLPPHWHDRVDRDRDRRHHRRRRGVIVEGSGISIGGTFRDDDLKVKFHAGSPFVVPVDPWCSVPFVSPFGVFYGYDDDARYPIDGYYSAVDPALLAAYHAAQAPAQAAPPAPPPRPLTPLERADALLAAGDERAAIDAYREHLAASPDDAGALRSLALALFEAREVKEAVAVMAMAYRMDPTLAARPLSAEALPRGGRSLRASVSRASVYANRTNSASAWLALAVLMQAEDRDGVALRMLERARAAGLEEPVAERMGAALAL